MRSSILFLFVAKLDNLKRRKGSVKRRLLQVQWAVEGETGDFERERERERERVRRVKCECDKGVTYAKGRGEDATNLQGYRQHKFPGRNKKLIF